MRHLTGATRLAFLAFFLSHIPITLLVDGQAAIPRALYPQFAIDLVDWYGAAFKDTLMTPPHAPWFRAVVAGELAFQLPFFFVASYALATRRVDGAGWFRSGCMIYGAHTSTTLIPILASIASDAATTVEEKAVLVGFYLPYLIFPLWLTAIAATSRDVFGGAGKLKAQ
eukprot:TRINITY_DN7571_c0_g1_i1.p1 TRINITY_DN7571_c0_g1~~TRINITY_DN7571_c0_g1_i1.p1  ORF type:complete len:169 (+),score=57.16 TRINITY_DN7571_c0_g1_i1:397-903(+)